MLIVNIVAIKAILIINYNDKTVSINSIYATDNDEYIPYCFPTKLCQFIYSSDSKNRPEHSPSMSMLVLTAK